MHVGKRECGCVGVCCQFSPSRVQNCFGERVGTPGEGTWSQPLAIFLCEDVSLSPAPSGRWAVRWMERIRSRESCVRTGAFWGRPLAGAVQGCERAVGLKDSELQTPVPAHVGFRAPSCVHACSRVPALAHVYAYLSLALFFHMHFVHLLFCPPCCCCHLSLFLPLFPALLCCLLLHHVPLYSF